MRVVTLKLDHGQDEFVGLVEGVEDLISGDGDSVSTANASLDFDEAQLAGLGHAALDVVADLFELTVDGLKTELPLNVHDDGARPRRANLGINWSDRSWRFPLHCLDESQRDNQHATEHHRRQRRNLRYQLQLF